MKNAALCGKPHARNPHVRFGEGEVESKKMSRGFLLCRTTIRTLTILAALAFGGLSAQAAEVRILRPGCQINADNVDPDELRTFLNNGGYAIITDAVYRRAWEFFKLVDKDLGGVAEGEGCRSWMKDGDSQTVPFGETPHPLVTFPNYIDDGDYWGHFNGRRCKGWTVLEVCGDGEPMMIYRPVGKGGLIACANLWWFGEVPTRLMENIKAWVALNEAGIKAKSAGFTPFRNGKGNVRISVEEPPAVKAKLVLTVKSEEKGVKPLVFSKQFADDGVTLDYELKILGRREIELAVDAGETRTTVFTKTVDFGPPLTIAPCDKRGRLSTRRRTEGVWLKAGINPAKGKLDNGRIRVTIKPATGGKTIVKEEVRLPEKDVPIEYTFSVRFPKSAPAGRYVVSADLKPVLGPTLGKAETELEVVEPAEGQFIVDADGMILRNGQPFFPLGIYHAEPDDYEEVKGLGFNFAQSFRHQMIQKAEESGLPVLIEGNHKDISSNALDAWLKSPATAMWYVADEPKEKDEERLQSSYVGFRDWDKSSLTFIASNRPDLFGWLAGFADVFSCDCYGDMGKCVDWLRRANRQIRPGQAFIFVPPAVPWEKPYLRAQAFLGIAHGANGLIWYTWRDPCHPKETLYDREEQKAEFKTLLAELNSNMDYLTSTGRVRFETGGIHGIVLGDPEKSRRAFVVNVLPKESANAAVELADGTSLNIELGPLEARIMEVPSAAKKQSSREKKAKQDEKKTRKGILK